jgi:photosystem II stability/assembly factor-like uncharacterized protein
MSIIKSYYVARAGNKAGVSYDSTSFEDITSFNPVFASTTPSVGVDPGNGNRIVFTGAAGGADILRMSVDSGVNLDTPGGTWSANYVNLNGGNGASISWLDSENIIISGNNGVIKSTDGGLTFNYVVPTEDFTTLYDDDITLARTYFSTTSLGLLALAKADGLVSTKLYKTTDGGINWTEITTYTPTNIYASITDLWISEDGLKIIGVTKTGVFRSTNGGILFTYPLTFSVVNQAGYGSKITAVNNTVYYVSGGAGAIYKTINGGVSWTQQRIGLTSDTVFGLHFYNDTSGFIAISDRLYSTTDSAVTIQEISNIGTTVVELTSIEYNCGECPPSYTKTAIDTCSGIERLPDQCGPGFAYVEEINSCVGGDDCPPTEIVFVLDVGGSVTSPPQGTEQVEMQAFLQAIVNAPNVQATLISGVLKLGFCVFAGDAPTTSGYTLDLTSDIPSINAYIANFINLDPSGGTNTSAGFERGTGILFGTNSSITAGKKIILVTDGFAASLPLNASTDTFVISNNDGLSNTWTITNNTTPPCGRQNGASNPTDCTRCEIYTTAMEIADYIKNTLGVDLTLAILTGQTPVNLNDILTEVQNPGGSPTVEAYLTYRAYVTGYLDQMTHMFPLSQDPTSTWYIGDDAYKPPSPIAGGHLSQIGLTNQNTGISFGRLIYGPQASTTPGMADGSTRMANYSSNASQVWPALPGIYGTQTTPAISVTKSTFDPYGLWDCNLPGDLPNPYAPMCGTKPNGDLDLYVSSFADAATQLAPEIAASLCSTAIEVVCPVGCTLVKTIENATCDCPKTLIIPSCVYSIYSCDNLSNPIYCTTNDLSSDVGNVVNISIDGSPIQGCFKIGFSDKDYCDQYTNIGVTDTYISCEDCQPKAYKLTTCAENSNISIYTIQEDMLDYVDKVVVLTDYPKLCWSVTEELLIGGETIQTVVVSQDYPDCPCCFEYQH